MHSQSSQSHSQSSQSSSDDDNISSYSDVFDSSGSSGKANLDAYYHHHLKIAMIESVIAMRSFYILGKVDLSSCFALHWFSIKVSGICGSDIQ
jgi:hypothetical protein